MRGISIIRMFVLFQVIYRFNVIPKFQPYFIEKNTTLKFIYKLPTPKYPDNLELKKMIGCIILFELKCISKL